MLIPPEDAPPLICEVMKNCWKTEPKHRITFPQIKQVLEEAYCSNVQSLKVSSIIVGTNMFQQRCYRCCD